MLYISKSIPTHTYASIVQMLTNYNRYENQSYHIPKSNEKHQICLRNLLIFLKPDQYFKPYTCGLTPYSSQGSTLSLSI